MNHEEIDRLRARIAELETANMSFPVCADHAGDILKHEECVICCQEQLGCRIAELERNRITEEQIDAAWEFNEDSDREIEAHGRAMLYTLGIVACKMCGGGGEKVTTGFDSRLQADTDAEYECPACHRNGKSHGWVWKEKP